ncbi:MAG: DNA polymerase III subunit gamma/tau [Pseudomonadales bacterium]|nr:DNA polymerase III subunit gamma/tau [Pseudomonadales bacterium]
MTYQVLARRWRPQTFAQMVGQEHVLRALVNALDRNRLHHAYLLTGTRGVGKTTLARLIAKSLNCEQGVSSTPCGVCSACREIAEGRFVDLLEVDAASRTKVEDTRELLDNVQYAPARGRYKVYLIDEVHMLSGHSFNALLKTLEEPPPHVKFLLATTDPQRLPATVLSRCLQFHLKNLSPEQIAGHLAQVLEQEGIGFETPALWSLAEAAEGSMRDALSLTDQAIAHAAGTISALAVTEMLGYVDRELLGALVDALLAADAAAVLAALAMMAQQGTDFERALAELLGVLHRIALAQAVPAMLDTLHGDRARYAAWAQGAVAADVQLYYQIGLLCRRDISYAPDARSGVEMALLRMLAFRPSTATDIQGGAARPVSPQRVDMPAQGALPASKKPDPAAAAPAGPVTTEAPLQTAERQVGDPRHDSAVPRDLDVLSAANWAALLAGLDLGGVARSVAANSVPERVDSGVVHLLLQEQQAMLYNVQCDERIAAALSVHFDRTIKVCTRIGTPAAETPATRELRIQAARQQQAIEAIEADANVRALLSEFAGRLHRDSIKALTVSNESAMAREES